LTQADERIREGRLAEARVTLGRAEGWLGQAGPADLRARLDQTRDRLELVRMLEDTRLPETERRDWEKFWADVKSLRTRAVAEKPLSPDAGTKEKK
jgi:hypothetical protein